jgi:hypothetical protein
MSSHTLAYRVLHLPDPAYPRFRAYASGDVRSAIHSAHAHLLRTVSCCSPHSLALALRMHFRPRDSGTNPQSRLSLEVIANAIDGALQQSVKVLVEGSALAEYYDLRASAPKAVDFESFGAACDVVRDECAIKPLFAPEFNPRIPLAYYLAAPFTPRSGNDYLAVDRVLGRIQEPVFIEICLEPTCIQKEQAAHTADMARLQSINRPYEWREQVEELEDDPFASAGTTRWHSKGTLEPLQRRDPLAEDVLRRRRRFHETLTQPHVMFHIRVFAKSAAVAHLLGSVVAESAFSEGSYKLMHSKAGDSVFNDAVAASRAARVSGIPTHETLFGQSDTPDVGLARWGHLATVEELSAAWLLPVASHGSPRCIRKNTDPPHVEQSELIRLGVDDAAQPTDEPCSQVWRGISQAQLAKHCALFGMPGSGKTNATLALLLQLFDRKIPFLVIENAKAEYRVLKALGECDDERARGLARTLQVYTPGCERVSPFRHNPLYHHPDIDHDEHIEHLLNCFRAAMPMSGPLPALLSEALERVYAEQPDVNEPPVMTDLRHAANAVLAEKRYSSELASDLAAALLVRLGPLTRRTIGRIFQCGVNAPSLSALMGGYSLLELEALPSELKCLLTLFLLTAIRQHVRALGAPRDTPRLVLVIEEAHHVIGRGGQAAASEDNPDPRAFAAEYVCQMLAELRALGVSIVVVDQLATALAPEVVKNTGSKLTFRQVDAEEREILGDAMLFEDVEMAEIARLRPGQAYLYTEGYYGPRRIRTPDLKSDLDLPLAPSNSELAGCIRRESWFREAALARAGDELPRLARALDRFDGLRDSAHAEIRGLLKQSGTQAEHSDAGDSATGAVRRVKSLHESLEAAFLELERGPWRNLLGTELPEDVEDCGLGAARSALIHRFEGIMRPQVVELAEVLRGLVKRLERGRSRRS